MSAVAYFFLFAIISVFLSSCSSPEIKRKGNFIAPFDGEKFNNLEPFPDKSFFTVMKWRFTRERAEWKPVENQRFFVPEVRRSESPRLTMIGHSTVLVQMDNLNILTDPHYSDRASPVSWAGPKRVIQPAIKFKDLPPIDLVIISHNHYDHLDLPTLKKLSDRDAPVVLAGLGNQIFLENEGIKNVREMDWWEKLTVKGLSVHFTPVQHWSARGLFDKRKTLWGGFLLEGTQKKVFFAGDTGYGKVFKQIHERYGAIDIGLIPIGAYEPRWFMKYAHLNPSDAVQVFQDLKMKSAFGVHFATFAGLTDEPKEQPVLDLKKALNEEGIEQSRFIAPEFGKTYQY